jgi:regulatory protein
MPYQRKKLLKPINPDEALQKLENYCAYQERSPKEVWDKLSDLGIQGQDADQIWAVLVQDGYVNERRFAESYARGKFRNNHWGRIRIRQALRMRAISAENVKAGLDAIDETEYTTVLSQLLEKKLRHYANEDKYRDKAAASLIRAGFEPDLIFAFLSKKHFDER